MMDEWTKKMWYGILSGHKKKESLPLETTSMDLENTMLESLLWFES